MRIFLLALCLCLFAEGVCQKKKEFYDYYFRPTTGRGKYLVITEPESGMWKRTAYYVPSGTEAMEVTFKDEDGKIKEGTEYWFYENKQLKSQINYLHGKKSGVAAHFSESGKLLDSANYLNDHIVGVKVVWNPDGYVEDSIKYDGNGNGYGTNYNKEGR